MTLPDQTQTDSITLTTAAANAVQDLLTKRNLEGYALRVYVAGGGCSGYQYGMALEGQIRDTDNIFDKQGVKVVVDEISIDYLRGSTIDYIEDVMGSGFKIENPNALSSCGCGNSFRTKDQPEDESAAEGDSCGCGGSCGCS